MAAELPRVEACPQCGTQLAATMLACPSCARLVHADQLAALAEEAKAAGDRRDVSAALAAWREALELLPTRSRQHQVISAKITELGRSIPFTAGPAGAAGEKRSVALRIMTGASLVGVSLWKLKALLLGLTKGTTLLSMLLSLGVYWTAWGWKFALGLVLSIYVHEIGHVIALRRYGFKASAPMFVPGLGALIRLQQQVVSPLEDAAIGLAGPIYGLGAAAFALGLWLATDSQIFVAIASVGAWINLFNLLPVATLDGGRGFHAMSRVQKLLAAITAASAWLCAQDGLLTLLAIVCAWRTVTDKSDQAGSWRTTAVYCLLVVVLTAIAAARTQAGLEA